METTTTQTGATANRRADATVTLTLVDRENKRTNSVQWAQYLNVDRKVKKGARKGQTDTVPMVYRAEGKGFGTQNSQSVDRSFNSAEFNPTHYIISVDGERVNHGALSGELTFTEGVITVETETVETGALTADRLDISVKCVPHTVQRSAPVTITDASDELLALFDDDESGDLD